MGAVEWSPELALARHRIAAWTALLRTCKGIKINSRLVRRLVKKANLSLPKRLSTDTIITNLKAAYKDYSNLKKQASSLHDTFFEQLAHEQAQDHNLNAATHLKTLREQEWQRLSYWWIRVIHQPDRQYGGLAMVMTPDGNECHSKESIENACLQENQACFNQASDTPLLQPPLYGLLGPLGMGTAASAILKGKF